MTTNERLARCAALADAAGQLARELERMNIELSELRDGMRDSLGLVPIRDERQETFRKLVPSRPFGSGHVVRERADV